VQVSVAGCKKPPKASAKDPASKAQHKQKQMGKHGQCYHEVLVLLIGHMCSPSQNALLMRHSAVVDWETCCSYRPSQMHNAVLNIPHAQCFTDMEKPQQTLSTTDVLLIICCQRSHKQTGTSSHQHVSEVETRLGFFSVERHSF